MHRIVFYQTLSWNIEQIEASKSAVLYSKVSYHSLHMNAAIPGVSIESHTKLEVTNNAQNFHWKGYGFNMFIPKDCLPAKAESKHYTIHLYATISQKCYSFPKNHELMSAVYWIRCNPLCRFRNPITIEIQHCAYGEAVKGLSFVRALCSQTYLPYDFKKLEPQGSFSDSSSYGSILLTGFSGIGIVSSVDPQIPRSMEPQRKHTATLYYLSKSISNWTIHLAITWDLETCINVSEE